MYKASPVPPKRAGPPTHRAHALYLAVIAILVVVLVYAAGRAIRSHQLLKEIQARFGLGGEVRSSLPRREPLRTVTAEALLRERTYDEYQREVDEIIERALALGEFGPAGRLAEACAYALQGGKRLRSVILMEIARALTARDQKAGGAALQPVDPADAVLFVEFLHAASLAIDDLPDFDDDATRRGGAALHVKTDPAVAQMAALSLVAAAFQDICRQIDWIRDNCPEFKGVDLIGTRLCHDVSVALGAGGAAGGQFMDSSLSEEELFASHGEGAVLEIAQLKTATFFEVAFVAGWLLAGGAPEKGADLREAGRHFGTAFQIADDIGDMAQDAARRAAKKTGWNYANHYGEAAARKAVAQNLNACRRYLEAEELYTPLWREICEKVWQMCPTA